MRTSGAVQVIVAVGLLVLALSPLAMVTSPSPGTADPSLDQPRFAPTGDPGLDPSSPVDAGVNSVTDRRLVPRVDPQVRVVAELESGAEVPDQIRTKYGGNFSTNASARRLSGTVSLSEVREFSATPGVTAVHIKDAPAIDDQYVAAGVRKTGLAALHERGITGSNVTVGIIDSSFRVSHPSIASQVSSYRMFSSSGSGVHGTAVASVVADAAPDANLHLAAVGSQTTPQEYREAVAWLRNSGADVIVDAGSYLGQPGNGNGSISRIAEKAARDVAFVTSAGNYANRHWAGIDHPGNESDWITFGNGREGNVLAGGRRISGRVSIGLSWNGSADYDLYLYRKTDAGRFAWATSTTGGQSENISKVVWPGRYQVAIRYNASGSNVSNPQYLSLFANRQLGNRTAAGSVTAPATAPGVIAVGAVDGTDVEPFSSRGPTIDGRRGVDVVAPDDARITGITIGSGTSYAAPYVAGTIAALKGEFPGMSTPRIGEIVTESATDIGPEGPDTLSGYGRLDARAAADRIQTLVLERVWPVDPSPDPKE